MGRTAYRLAFALYLCSANGGAVPAAAESGARFWAVSAQRGVDEPSCGSDVVPCATISYVDKTKVRPGDTVYVSGHFELTPRTCIVTRTDGRPAAPITYQARPPGSAAIDGRGACTAMWLEEGSYVRVFGFDFTGAQENLAKNGGSSVFLANGADGATEFAHNVVHDLPWKINTAIDMVPHDNHRYTGASCSVHDNVFHDIALGKPATVTLAGYAMYIACGSDSQVYNNLIYREGSVGIHCWHAADRVFIYNNTIYDAGTGIIVGTGDGGYVSNAFFVVANNIVAHSRLSIIAESSRPGTISASSEFLNNLLYDNGSDWYYDASGVNTTITAKMIVRNTLVADPMFVSETRFDFNLRSDSPAIRAGYGPGAPDHDLDGFARPRGPVDIGAYQGRVNGR